MWYKIGIIGYKKNKYPINSFYSNEEKLPIIHQQ